MVQRYDLSKLAWRVSGTMPYMWKLQTLSGDDKAEVTDFEVAPIPARVPGSVQQALLEAGILPDWLEGLNYRDCEWVENRHWIYEAKLPAGWFAPGRRVVLHCEGLDGMGWIYVNWQQAGRFESTHLAYDFDLTDFLHGDDNTLRIIFDLSPRWLGQLGYTSRMTQWKTRYNYTWDWVCRLVQVGVWAPLSLVVHEGARIDWLSCTGDFDLASGRGKLLIRGNAPGDALRLTLEREGQAIASREIGAGAIEDWWEGLPVEPWWPNGMGEQTLYDLGVELLHGGKVVDSLRHTLGFKHVAWQACEGAPNGADPWLCVVNGQPLFLQGVNFQPIRANFADLTREDYRKRIELYRDLGANVFRINACGFLEHTWLYELCDTCGILVWQEFPITSAGIDNRPPEGADSIREMEEIARGFVRRRMHHASLLMWSGGNELMDVRVTGQGVVHRPCDLGHPMLEALGRVSEAEDPVHRYVATSPLGPRAFAERGEMGQGLHWDVHGPYPAFADLEEEADYWRHDDALFRSEMSHPGANPAHLIRRYAGELDPWPPTRDNPMWLRPVSWWIDWDIIVKHLGYKPQNLEDYVEASQGNQARGLALAMQACKDRFPRCGGALLWGSHDTYPVAANTTIIDFEGNPKPAALALGRIWRKE